MSIVDFIRGSLHRMHGQYDEAVGDLTDEPLHWRANERGLPASFVLWHYVRTEDNMCLTHGFTHLGELAHLRGLMGLCGMAV